MPETLLAFDRNGVAPIPEVPEDGIDLHSLLHMFARRKRIVAYAIAAGLLLAIATCWIMTPQYDAVDTLNINPEGGNSLDLGDLTDLMSGATGLDWEAKVQTQVLIISSEPLAWEVVRELRLDRNPAFMRPGLLDRFSHCKLTMTPPASTFESIPPCRQYAMLKRFSKALDVEAVPKTQAIQIRFRSVDPSLSASIVNTLAAAYLHYNFITRYNATMQASSWLQDRLAEMRHNMESAEANLAAYQKSANIIGTDESDNLATDQLSDMGKQLTDAEADRIVKESHYRLAMTGNPELIGNIVPDSVLPTLRSQQAQLNVLLAQAESEYGDKYPKVIQLKSQLTEVHAALEKETADIQARFKSEFDAAQHTEDNIRAAMDQLQQKAFAESAKFDRYDMLRNEVNSTQDLYDDLLKKLNEAGVTAGLKSTNVDVIAPAQAPVKPTLPAVPLFFLVGILGGLVIGVIGVIVIDNLDHTIRGFDDAQEIAGAPVIGLLPHASFDANGVSASVALSESGSLRLSRLCAPRSEFTEAVSSLRTSLLLSSPGKPPKVIMVASPLPAEGKSLISLNLGAALARLGRRVLVIDADLRRGALLNQIQGDAMQGLSGCITGAAEWQDEIAKFPLPQDDGTLYVLPSGLRPPNPAELLGSPQMAKLLDAIREEFDHIIVDTAPVAIVADAMVLSKLVDAVLLLARLNKTTRFALADATRSLVRVSARVTGIILNDEDVARRYYGYGNYKHYYSYYRSERRLTDDSAAPAQRAR